jgi:hypothetical protein
LWLVNGQRVNDNYFHRGIVYEDWVQILAELDCEPSTDGTHSLFDESLLRKSLRVLVKAVEDFKPAEAIIKQWLSDQKKAPVVAAAAIVPVVRHN